MDGHAGFCQGVAWPGVREQPVQLRYRRPLGQLRIPLFALFHAVLARGNGICRSGADLATRVLRVLDAAVKPGATALHALRRLQLSLRTKHAARAQPHACRTTETFALLLVKAFAWRFTARVPAICAHLSALLSGGGGACGSVIGGGIWCRSASALHALHDGLPYCRPRRTVPNLLLRWVYFVALAWAEAGLAVDVTAEVPRHTTALFELVRGTRVTAPRCWLRA